MLTNVVTCVRLGLGCAFVVGGVGLAAWHHWGYRWRVGAHELLRDYDESNEDEAVSPLIDGEWTETPKQFVLCGKTRKRTRRRLAHELAREAFFQYGQRSCDEASLAITRKFMRDYIKSEYPTMRRHDGSAAVEIALPLSYVPPHDAMDLKRFVVTPEWRKRVHGTASWFSWVLGNIQPPRSYEREG